MASTINAAVKIKSHSNGNFQLMLLHEFALMLNSTHNNQEIFRQSAGKISEIMEGDGCHILFCKKNDEILKLETAIHYGDKPFPSGVNETKGISGLTFEINDIVVVTDAENDPRVTKKMQQHFGHKSMLSVPIMVKGRTIGVLVVYSKYPFKYDYDDGRFLMMLGNHLGMAVENAELMMELQKAAILDPLTEVYNYRYFRNELECNLRNQSGEPVSLVLIDLNDFKKVNDNYGHLVGDRVLQKIAKMLQENVRSRDSVTRNGGDEFALILPGADSQEVFRIMKRIEKAVSSQLFIHSEQAVTLSISWGAITTYNGDDKTVEKVVNMADNRLYQMKRKKQGCGGKYAENI